MVIVWLAGHSAGLGGNYRFPQQPKPNPQQSQEKQVQLVNQGTPKQPSVQGETSLSGDPTASEQKVAIAPTPLSVKTSSDFKLSPSAIVAILIATPFVIALALFFGWLSARFNFVFIDLLVRRDIRIRESFRTYKTFGNSYFLWSLGFTLIAILVLGLSILGIIFSAAKAKALLLLFVPLALFALLAALVVVLLVSDFVLPMMYRESSLNTMEGLKKFFSFRAGIGRIAFYFLIKIGLGILAGIFALVIALVIGIAAFVIGLLIALLGSLLLGVLPILKPILIAVGIIGITVGVLAIIILLSFATLPISIFFGTFTLSYLARLIPTYNLLNSPSSSSNA